MFIKIGGRLLHTDHIIEVEHRDRMPATLWITTSERIGEYNKVHCWQGEWATTLWEQLCEYLGPTVLTIPDPAPTVYTAAEDDEPIPF